MIPCTVPITRGAITTNKLKQAIHAATLLLQQKLQQLPKYWYGGASQLVARNRTATFVEATKLPRVWPA